MFCPHCGKELVDNTDACPYCGASTHFKPAATPIPAASPARTLSVVGFVLNGLAVFIPVIVLIIAVFGVFENGNIYWTICLGTFFLVVVATVLTLIGFLKERKQKSYSVGLVAFATSVVTFLYCLLMLISAIQNLIESSAMM